MTAQELHTLTMPLFERHPSARPDFLQYSPETRLCPWHNRSGDGFEAYEAALIIQGHLAEWLAARRPSGQAMKIDRSNLAPKECRWRVDGDLGPTFLEALIAACMEVPHDPS